MKTILTRKTITTVIISLAVLGSIPLTNRAFSLEESGLSQDHYRPFLSMIHWGADVELIRKNTANYTKAAAQVVAVARDKRLSDRDKQTLIQQHIDYARSELRRESSSMPGFVADIFSARLDEAQALNEKGDFEGVASHASFVRGVLGIVSGGF